jgi:hypothetical protein
MRTIQAMLATYCRKHHRSHPRAAIASAKIELPPGLCDECQELMLYAETRLSRCPFKQEKPSCAQCPIHCYGARPRAEMQNVMRATGPGMLWRHPVLAILHLWDGWRWKPGSGS